MGVFWPGSLLLRILQFGSSEYPSAAQQPCMVVASVHSVRVIVHKSHAVI